MDARHGTLGRESEFFVVVRVYVFSSGFYAANQSSAACDRRLRQSVETSTPPFEVRANYRISRVPQWEFVPDLQLPPFSAADTFRS